MAVVSVKTQSALSMSSNWCRDAKEAEEVQLLPGQTVYDRLICEREGRFTVDTGDPDYGTVVIDRSTARDDETYQWHGWVDEDDDDSPAKIRRTLAVEENAMDESSSSTCEAKVDLGSGRILCRERGQV